MSENEIIDACKIANIHNFILSLPEGYGTMISINGNNLSGGQKQQLSIARAILKKSKIILFDEATSSVDSDSQYKIKNSINILAESHTIILVTHKLIDIIDADEILVMNEGVISEHGSHEKLIKQSNTYKRLYKSENDILNNLS